MSVDRALAAMIDHTLLRADAIGAEVDQLCDEALTFGFRTVCVQPVFVARASRRLGSTGTAVSGPGAVGVTAVVGFPQGANTTEAKLFETGRALADGATEIDMVANLGWIRGGDDRAVSSEVARIVALASDAGATVKVILETALFSDELKEAAAHAAVAGGAAFVKTSTGFGPSGATVHDVALLRRAVGAGLGVKASGGVKTRAQALALVAAGANRLGASGSITLVTVTAGAAGSRGSP